jgi:PHD/YefM family antitoxin component YafN of YafNO toxin-antitoxin module
VEGLVKSMEKILSVSSARQNLMKSTREISDRMDRVVLTNKGKAETVLLSLAEYQSLEAAAQLLTHPHVFTEMNQGFGGD